MTDFSKAPINKGNSILNGKNNLGWDILINGFDVEKKGNLIPYLPLTQFYIDENSNLTKLKKLFANKNECNDLINNKIADQKCFVTFSEMS